MDILHVAAMTWESNEDRFLIFLPLFFGYLLGSCLSLRGWLAAQKLPVLFRSEGSKVENSELADCMKDTKLILLTFGCMLFLLVLSMLWEPFRYTILILVAMGYFEAVTACPFFLCGFQLSAHRNRYGGLFTRFMSEDTSSTYQRLLPVITLLSFGCCFAIIWFRNNIGASVVFGMALCALETSESSQRHSIRSIINSNHFAAQNDKEEAGNHNTVASEDFRDWLFIIFATFPLASLFLFFLRLDLANHIVSVGTTQGSPIDIALEEVPASETIPLAQKQSITGIVVPSRIPFAFKPPYFISAFIAWLLANVALVQLSNHGLLSYSGRFAHAFGLLLTAPPLMILSAVNVSLSRGEMGHMWKFDGQYNLKIRNAVSDSEKTGELVDVKDTA